jgi:hypothetical protein
MNACVKVADMAHADNGGTQGICHKIHAFLCFAEEALLFFLQLYRIGNAADIFAVIGFGVGKGYKMAESPGDYIFIADYASVSVLFAAKHPCDVFGYGRFFGQNKSFCQCFHSTVFYN